ncbi:MAG: hypothetical protein EHM64_06515 [Ignavibacteriae bacterium]|nr:MAG: hypothetical protein EHM64_06515 [Ignavibacteriota bacterium]
MIDEVKKYVREFDNFNELITISKQIFVDKNKSNEIRDTNEWNFPLLLIYTKYVSTCESVLILCQQGKGHDAACLTRSLPESLINFLTILKNPKYYGLMYRRSYFITRLEGHGKTKNHEFNKGKDYFDWNIDEFMIEEEIKSQDEALIKINPDYNKIDQSKHDQRGEWSGLSFKEMANSLGKEVLWQYEYYYWLLSDFSHNNPFWLQVDFINDNDSHKIKIGENPSQDFVQFITMVAGEYLLNMIVNANTFFQLGKENIIEPVKNEYYRIQNNS